MTVQCWVSHKTYEIYKLYRIITLKNTINMSYTLLWIIFTHKIYRVKGVCNSSVILMLLMSVHSQFHAEKLRTTCHFYKVKETHKHAGSQNYSYCPYNPWNGITPAETVIQCLNTITNAALSKHHITLHYIMTHLTKAIHFLGCRYQLFKPTTDILRCWIHTQ